MDWLKDKKNLPFVITGAIVLIAGSIALLLFNLGVFNQSAPTPTVAAAPPPPPPMSAPPAAAAMPVRRPGLVGRTKKIIPGLPAASAATTPAKVAVVDETKPINPAAVHDPFSFSWLTNRTTLARQVKTLVGSIALPPVRGLLPSHDIYTADPADKQVNLAATVPSNGYLPGLQTPAPQAALPRVAGVLYDRGVYAILQPAYGQPQSVKPGDTVSGVGRVTSIQADGVTIRTISGTTVQLPVSAGPPANTPTYPGYPAYPGAPVYPGNPYQGGPYPGAPPGFTPPPGYVPGDPIDTGGPPNDPNPGTNL